MSKQVELSQLATELINSISDIRHELDKVVRALHEIEEGLEVLDNLIDELDKLVGV